MIDTDIKLASKSLLKEEGKYVNNQQLKQTLSDLIILQIIATNTVWPR